MSLLDVCNEYLVEGQQGQLVVKFTNDVHLCKILIADGVAVHISHGRIAPESILDSLPGKIVEWVNFIAGYPVRKRLDLPLQERLLQIARGQQRPLVTPLVSQQPPRATEPPQPVAVMQSSGPTISADKVAAAVDGFIDQIGPLGTILADNISVSLNYSTGEPMTQAIFINFVAALGEEVPEAARDKFIEQFGLPTT